MSKTILVSGLTIGVTSVVWMFAIFLFGWYKQTVSMNAFCAISLFEMGGILWGMRRYLVHKPSFLSLVTAGSLMAVIASVIIAFFSFIFTAYVFPQYFNELNRTYIAELSTKNLSADQTRMLLSQMQQFSTPFAQAFGSLIGVSLTGLIYSIVFACFLHPMSHFPKRHSR